MAGQINGRTYDFTDIRCKVGQEEFNVTSVSYNANRSIGKARYNRPHKVYRTRGSIDPEGEFKIFRHDLEDFLTALTTLAQADGTGNGFGDAKFDLTLTYGTDDQPVQTDVLRQCTLMNVDQSAEAGEDALEVTLTIDINEIVYSGGNTWFGEVV